MITYSVAGFHLGDSCENDVPYQVYSQQNPNCESDTCVDTFTALGSDSFYSAYTSDKTEVQCTTSVDAILDMARKMFGSSSYVIRSDFTDDNCSTFESTVGHPATASCIGAYNDNVSYHYRAALYDNGSASISIFTDRSCLASFIWSTNFGDADAVANHTCVASSAGKWSRWYSSNDDSKNVNVDANDANGGGLSTAAGVGIAVGVVIAVVVIMVAIFIRRRRSNRAKSAKEGLDITSSSTESLADIWHDEVIVTKRIPRDKVQVKKLISRGAFGEVYSGVYNGHAVAIKMLLPATRGSLEHVNDFLSEAKMTAAMDHPHIVNFVGVAWDSLSDLCVVLEFMDNGDLRTLLDKYMKSNHPVGFDREKATIALHVCHALTYLHSLLPPVIHRDLKSRNILLNKKMEAKLTDFGISRERLDQTMTAGVGTSLWMAPEVMLGEKYDVKADMFSFGVVLSELDVHTLPYSHTRKQNDGHEMADATLLQRISTGSLRVEFSHANPQSILQLGNACVSVSPNERPSAAEALYTLQRALAQDLWQLEPRK